jgi:glutamate-ammonia-ligase adenylyltransferase
VDAVRKQTDFGRKLAGLRKKWVRLLLEIVIADVLERVTLQEVKRLQTELAEASIDAALLIVKSELEKRYSIRIRKFPFAVLGLGKLGGRGVDYDSDLDVILVYDDNFTPSGLNVTLAEFYSRAAEIFVTALSSMTRDGSLYRVDLRLRPFGKNGTSSISKKSFLEYVENTAAIWEMLAYVKIRAVAGDMELATPAETESRGNIHRRACTIEHVELATETINVRRRLEAERGRTRGKEIDIKYGSGGMLDIYFATRFLQLRDNVPDDAEHRATAPILQKLREEGSLSEEHFTVLLDGYNFFAALDHNIRLTVGRTTRVPIANRKALDVIAERMKIDSPDELLEQLTIHRLNIRNVFEEILS